MKLQQQTSLASLLLAGGLVAAGSWVTWFGQAQVPDAPVRGFTFPILDPETLRMTARVRGDIAQPLDSERIDVEGVRVESYGEGDSTNLVVLTKRCRLYVQERRLESEEELSVSSGSGQLALVGRGFSWDVTNGLVITSQVQARLERPRPAGEIRRPPVEPLQIESDRFTYREGLVAFSEQVQLAEGGDRLSCDTLLLQLRLAPGDLAPAGASADLSRQVDSVQAEGRVEVVSTNLTARAERADYAMASQQLRLTGGAQWQSGDREGRADTILLDRPSDRLWAEGGVWMRLPTGALSAVSPFGGEASEGERAPAMVEVRSVTLEVVPDPDDATVNRAVFRDQVRVSQGAGGVECEQLVVRYADVGASRGDATEVGAAVQEGLFLVGATADGGVSFRQATNVVTGARAVYLAGSGVMDVDGPVGWELEGRRGRADRLRLNPITKIAEALGGVQMSLPPGSLGPVSRALGAGKVGGGGGADSTGDEAPATPSPVQVVCETFTYREPGPGREFGVADFLGGVHVTSGPDLSLECQRMLAEIETVTNALHRLVATGEVSIKAKDTRGRREARGDRAEYVAREDRLWLTGDDGVEMEFEEPDGTHHGRGRLAVYEGASGMLELRNDAVLESVHGRLTGDVVRVDLEGQVLEAGGRWKMVIPARGASDALSAFTEGSQQP